MKEIFEMLMLICFGISWPLNLMKSIKSKTAKGKSIFFLCFILIGYFCGILSKVVGANITYVLIFYVLNFLMVFADIMLYVRNRNFDKRKSIN